MKLHHFVLGLAMSVVAACGPSVPGQAAAPKTQRDVLTREEIANSPQDISTLYSAIQSLRPQFLASPLGVQPGSAKKTIAIYVNGALQSGTEVLQGISAGNVDEVRYLDPIRAQSQYGQVASGGAILVTLRKGSPDP
jgi:hypothetical protein